MNSECVIQGHKKVVRKEKIMIRKRPVALLLAIVLAVCVLAGCGDDSAADNDVSGDNENAKVSEETVSDEDDPEDENISAGAAKRSSDDTSKIYADSLNSEAFERDGAIQMFVGEKLSDMKITNEDEALDLVYAVLDYVGGDDSTQLDIDAVDGPTEEGNKIYTFRQMADDVEVYGASVKLITDKDGIAIGLNSTLVPGLEVSSDVNWSIDASEAEAIVKETLKEDGVSVNIIPNVTEQTLLPIEDDDYTYLYVWVVYTRNFYDDVDTAYLAHYVDCSGNYLYCNPVTEPGNTDALSGAGATFAFDGMEADTWTGTVTKYHGEKEEVTIPVAKDPQTGDIYLADVDRKIMCADYSDFWDEDTLTLRAAQNGKFQDNEVLTYKSFVEIYDFFETIGWNGPDGEGSPTVLLMDWVDDDGQPVHNACYSGKVQGFNVFQFNREEPDGEAYDVMAHEFTHAVTGTAMITNIYMNDYGAINEAMSDIFGNLIESLMGKTEDKTWLIEENGIEPIRSMSDPHRFEQPAFVWDKYYVPAVSEASDNNDNGGVHTNSSLLNLIAYRLNESGMDQSDQLYYWMNVALILTPRTDYKQIADILPWTLKLVGMEEYTDVINKAIGETDIQSKNLPDKVPADLARFQMIFPEESILESYEVYVVAYNIDNDAQYTTWPEDKTDLIALTVDPGLYVLEMLIVDKETGDQLEIIKDRQGWKDYSEDDAAENVISIGKGEIYELNADELMNYLLE